MLAGIASGAWLTRERLFVYAGMLLAASLISAVVWVALADGLVDRIGQPIGTDFSNVWAAGKLVLGGEPAAPYDLARHYAAEKEAFGGRDVPFYGWHYPPLFLVVAAGLALLPYAWALLVWSALTLAAYLVVMRAILPRPETLLLALAFPAVFVNLGHGQNGFLSAALIGGSLLLLDRRPIVAGVLVAALAYKPQLGLLYPFVLLLTGRWTVIVAAAVTLVASCAMTLWLFGPEVWTAFLDSTGFTRTVVLELGGPGWHKMQSAFAAVRMWGGTIPMAYAVQGAVVLAVSGSLIWLWRSAASSDLKAAAFACACLLTAPYVLDYDFVVLGVSIVFFVRHGLEHGFHRYEISMLAFAWISPLVARSIAGTIGLPVGLLAVMALYCLVVRRAFEDVAVTAPRASVSPA
jgi:alpha-1,2-mannosyltransferase